MVKGYVCCWVIEMFFCVGYVVTPVFYYYCVSFVCFIDDQVWVIHKLF